MQNMTFFNEKIYFCHFSDESDLRRKRNITMIEIYLCPKAGFSLSYFWSWFNDF